MRTAARGATTPNPFDCAWGCAKTPGVKLISLVVLFVISCGRANDLPAMKEEAEGLVSTYKVRFAHLRQRAEAILQRGNAIGVTSPDAANASRMFAQSKGKLEQLVAELDNAKAEIERVSKDKLEMRKYLDRTERSLESGFIEINSDFDAVESWISNAEQRRGTQVTQKTTVPPPGNPGQTGAGGTAPAPVQ